MSFEDLLCCSPSSSSLWQKWQDNQVCRGEWLTSRLCGRAGLQRAVLAALLGSAAGSPRGREGAGRELVSQ